MKIYWLFSFVTFNCVFSALNHLIGGFKKFNVKDDFVWSCWYLVKQGTVVNLNILFHILIQVKQLFSQSFMNGFENHDLPFYLADVIMIHFHENKQRYIEIINYCGCSNS